MFQFAIQLINNRENSKGGLSGIQSPFMGKYDFFEDYEVSSRIVPVLVMDIEKAGKIPAPIMSAMLPAKNARLT